MLITNQNIEYDFSLKDPIRIDDFKYKSGEVDGDGIIVNLKNVALTEDVFIMVNWLHSTSEQYVYVPTSATIVQEGTISIKPPRTVLISDHISFEIIASDGKSWMLKGPTVTIPVLESLISEEFVPDDEDSITLELVHQNESTHAMAVTTLGTLTGTKELIDGGQLVIELSENERVFEYNNEIENSSAATQSANDKKALADAASSAAQSATDSANSSTEIVESTSIAIVEEAESVTRTSETIQSQSIELSDMVPSIRSAEESVLSSVAEAEAVVIESTAAAHGTIAVKNELDDAVADIVTCRTDGIGVARKNLTERLLADYNTIGSKLYVHKRFFSTNELSVDKTKTGPIENIKISGLSYINIKQKPIFSSAGIYLDREGETVSFYADPDYEGMYITHGVNILAGGTYTLVMKVNMESPRPNAFLKARIQDMSGYTFMSDVIIDKIGASGTYVAKFTIYPNVDVNNGPTVLWIGAGPGDADYFWQDDYIEISSIIIDGDYSDKEPDIVWGACLNTITSIASRGGSQLSEVRFSPALRLGGFPRGQCDEANISTGVLTRRVGTITLNGAEQDWKQEYGYWGLQIPNLKSRSLIQCNILPVKTFSGDMNGQVGVGSGSGGILYVKPFYSSTDLEQLRSFLGDYPITVIYELSSPVTENFQTQELLSHNGRTDISISRKIDADFSVDVLVQFREAMSLTSAAIENEAVAISALKDALSETAIERESEGIDNIKADWEMSARLFDMELATGSPAPHSLSPSRHEQAKKLILTNSYDRGLMLVQLEKYCKHGTITKEEFDSLVPLLDVSELTEQY